MWAWLAIPWVRKLGEAALLLAAIVGVVHWIYHSGKNAGMQEESGRETEANHAQMEQIRATFQESLDAGHRREDELSQMATKFADLAAAAEGRRQEAQAASAADATKIQALPDSAIKADLEARLGGPLENPAILRRDDEIVTDYPHKLDELKAGKDELDAVKQSLTTAQQQTATVAGERDGALAAYNGLMPLYVQAYNAAIQGHRKWYCLWLCKPKKTIRLPEPATLIGPKK